MSDPICIEVYVYDVRPDAVEEMLSIKDRLIEEAHTLDGLITSTTFRSADEPTVFIDQMIWRDRDAAIAGSKAFLDLPSSQRFLGLMTGPPRAGGRFHHSAGDILGKIS